MRVDAKICEAFNTVRIENQGREFSRKELFELLVNSIPRFYKQDYIITIFLQKRIILKIGEGKNIKYKFTDTPVHIDSLSSAVFTLKEYNRSNNSKFHNKKKEERIKENLENKYTHINEEYCIEYLKKRGYKVMKQIINFEEV